MSADTYLNLIRDAHARMATNRDPLYRAAQQKKIDEWLEKLSAMYEAGEWHP